MLDIKLDGVFEASEDDQEGGGELAQVVEHLKSHAHLGGILGTRWKR